MRRVIGLFALLSVACGAGGPPPPPPPPPAASAALPKADAAALPQAGAPVVVAIVVDQLSAWAADARLPALPEDGAFARLRREGTWLRRARYPYAVTDTAPGHAMLHTGRVPAESGIFANEVPDAQGKRVSILRDPAVRVVGPEGKREAPGSSPARLRVETVADRLRAAHPDALVVSVSLKDRGAILPAGKKPSHVLWFEAGMDSFVTSTAFADAYPAWARTLGDPKRVAELRASPWEPLDPAWVSEHAPTPDDQPGEGDLDGMGIRFPHGPKTAAAFRATPASDRALLDLALAAVSAEHDPKKPTLLLLSLSANDIVGHTFGPDSWEAWDHLRRLDLALAGFLDQLERRVGPVRVVLSADHGNVSMPEIDKARRAWCKGEAADPFERPCSGGRRIHPDAIRDDLRAAAKKALGPGDYVAGVADPYVFLTPEARALPAPRRAALDKAIRAVLDKQKDGIAEVLDVRDLETRCPRTLEKARGVPGRAAPGEDVLTLVCRSWSPSIGAGDYYIVPRPGSFFDADVVVGKGTSHGTPYLYDRTVPLLVRAPGVTPGEVVDDPVDIAVFSALESALLGLDTRAPRDVVEAHRVKN